MRNNEVTAELRNRVKPWLDVEMPQPSFSNTLRNIESNLSKPNTVKTFFERFGYEGEWNDFKLRADYVMPAQNKK